MSGAGPYKSHWKELVAQGAAKKKPLQDAASPEPEPETPIQKPAPQGATPSTVRALYQQYFHRFRYGWLAALVLIQLLCLMLVFGRSDVRPGRQPVFGAVSLRGQSPAYGSISFYPAEGHAGPAANTRIVKGRYQFSKADGPFVGPHRVVLSYVWDAEDEAQFQIPGTKGKESASAAPAAGEREAKEEGSTAANPAAKSRPHGHEVDVEVPATGSLQIDFEIPE
jgi:hypothetical protein